MRNKLRMAVAGYVFSVAVLLSFLYWFLKNEGFDESRFIIGSVAVLLLSVGWGYVIVSHLIAPQQKMHEELLHVTDDILHELKIPLATIDTNAAMIAKQSKDEKTQKRLLRIRAASKRLEKLYRELAYTLRKKIEPVELEFFDLSELLYERVSYFRQEGRHRIILEAESRNVRLDRIGFEQVIDNLISNAMKYSPPHSAITVRWKDDMLEISDEGKGMDETQLVCIFERYYRGDMHTNGRGLGLAIVKRFCDENGIGIRIESAIGKGTKITLDCRNITV